MSIIIKNSQERELHSVSRIKTTLRGVVVASILVAVVVIFAVLIIGSHADAAVRVEVVPEKTGMELVAKSTDKVVSKYVDYDAKTVCYVVDKGSFYSGAVAVSCLNQ